MKRLSITGVAILALSIGLLFSTTAIAQQYNAEIRKARATLKKEPANTSVKERLVQLYYLRGTEELQAGKTKKAVQTYGIAENVALRGNLPLSATLPAVEEARYGKAYGLLKLGQSQKALKELDNLLASSPGIGKALYLSATIHLAKGTVEGQQKAQEMYARMVNSPIDETKLMGARLLGVQGYNASTVYSALEKDDEAYRISNNIEETAGNALSEIPVEPHVMFASSVYQKNNGDQAAALSKLEILHDRHPDFELSNGVSVKKVLTNFYYQQGTSKAISAQQNKSKEEAQEALDLLEKAQAIGGSSGDISHAMFIAHTVMGNKKMATDINKEVQKDKTYIAQIKPAPAAQ